MREVGPALPRSLVRFRGGAIAINPLDYPMGFLYSKTPARIRASAGVRFAKQSFAPGLKTGSNLGLSARLPMPRGRQLARARWDHVREHPPAEVSGCRRAVPCRPDALTTLCIWVFDRGSSSGNFPGGKGVKFPGLGL